jgi:hypothetical protein
MTPRPATEIPISAQLETRARAVWIEPEIESLTLEQTEFHHGVGSDGNPDSPDCSKS